jgi:hypothetical protein
VHRLRLNVANGFHDTQLKKPGTAKAGHRVERPVFSRIYRAPASRNKSALAGSIAAHPTPDEVAESGARTPGLRLIVLP